MRSRQQLYKQLHKVAPAHGQQHPTVLEPLVHLSSPPRPLPSLLQLSRVGSSTTPQPLQPLAAAWPTQEAAPPPPAALCTPTCLQLPASPYSPRVDGADLLEGLWLPTGSPLQHPCPPAARQLSFARVPPPVVVLPGSDALATGTCASPDTGCTFSPFAMPPAAAPWHAAPTAAAVAPWHAAPTAAAVAPWHAAAAPVPSHPDQLLQMVHFSAGAAQREAERQLSLLQQLKCSIEASCCPIESSCNSRQAPLQQQPGGGCSTLLSELQQQASPMRRAGERGGCLLH